MNIILIRKRTVGTGVVNDVTCTRQSVITCVVERFMTRRYPLNKSDVIRYTTGS